MSTFQIAMFYGALAAVLTACGGFIVWVFERHDKPTNIVGSALVFGAVIFLVNLIPWPHNDTLPSPEDCHEGVGPIDLC